MTYIGIDVSKDSFVVAYSPEKACKTKTFKNTVKGIHKFIQTLSKDENHCVLEATGNYSALLVYLLSEAGIVTSVENPLKVKNFAKAMLSVIKTDEIDARLIALYGERMQPKPYTMPSKELLTLKQKRTVIRQLKKQLVANQNLRGSLEVLPFFDSDCKSAIDKTIVFLEKQLKKLERDLFDTASKEYKRQMELLTSIKGIGATLAAALIITTGRFTYFSNAKQLTRYLGLSPTYQQSGTSVHIRGHINHNGDPMLRDQLYIGALSALRSNTECRACYNRLQENGYPGKVAVVAVANKLIRQAFAVVTQGVPYEDGHVSKLHSASANVTA